MKEFKLCGTCKCLFCFKYATTSPILASAKRSSHGSDLIRCPFTVLASTCPGGQWLRWTMGARDDRGWSQKDTIFWSYEGHAWSGSDRVYHLFLKILSPIQDQYTIFESLREAQTTPEKVMVLGWQSTCSAKPSVARSEGWCALMVSRHSRYRRQNPNG